MANQYTYFNIDAKTTGQEAHKLWAAIQTERALKQNPLTSADALKQARMHRLQARRAFLDAQQTPNDKPVRIRYGTSFKQPLEFDPKALAAIVQPTAAVDTTIQKARPKTEKLVFKPQPIRTTAQKIDMRLTKLRNKLLYTFEPDQRYDMTFLQSLPNAPQPLQIAQQTQHYIQKTAVQFNTKWANVKESFAAYMAQLLTPARQTATTLLAGISLVAATQSQATPKPIKPITLAAQLNAPLQNLGAFDAFVKTHNINATKDQLKAAFDYAQTQGANFAESPTETWHKNIPVGTSGAFGMSASGFVQTGIFEKVKTGQSTPKNVAKFCADYNAANPTTIAIPQTGKNGLNTGKVTFAKLTENVTQKLGTNNVQAFYNTPQGAVMQIEAFLKLAAQDAKNSLTTNNPAYAAALRAASLKNLGVEKIAAARAQKTWVDSTQLVQGIKAPNYAWQKIEVSEESKTKKPPEAKNSQAAVIWVSDDMAIFEQAVLLEQQPKTTANVTLRNFSKKDKQHNFFENIKDIAKPWQYKLTRLFTRNKTAIVTTPTTKETSKYYKKDGVVYDKSIDHELRFNANYSIFGEQKPMIIIRPTPEKALETANKTLDELHNPPQPN